MSGPVALHGGGELGPGDAACLTAMLDLAGRRAGQGRAIHIVIVPTAAARWEPQQAGAHGIAAFEAIGSRTGGIVEAVAALVVDAASAADPDVIATLDGADLVYFPGGDPDVVVSVLAGSAAWAAIQRAHGAGAVLAGASAGAMALASWTWTPDGGVAALDVVPGLAVRPHADAATWAAVIDRFETGTPAGLGALGVPERTAAITVDVTADPITWWVVGEGEVRWLAVRGGPTIATPPGGTFTTRR